MDVLFAGNLPVVSDCFFQAVGQEYRCVTYYEKEKLNYRAKNVLSYYRREEDEELGNVFTAFGFDRVVYFSYTIDGSKQPFGELERLENVLYQCRKNNVKRFIYVTCNNLPAKEREEVEETGYLILKDACESLCRYAAENNGLKVEIVKVPYVFRKGAGENGFLFLKEALRKGTVNFPAEPDFTTDFLCDEDIGELLGRILDEPTPADFEILHLDGGNAMTFEELGALLQDTFPQTAISYGTDYDCVPRCRSGKRPRTEFGWYPKCRLQDAVAEAAAEQEQKKKKHASYERRMHGGEWKERLRILFEVIVMFAAAEFLNWWTSGNVMINFIDFRLIYVVMMGTMSGLAAGTLAAVLSCIGYLTVNAAETPWQILFYNVQNWLPFACYFLLGAISGYTRDKHDDEVRYEKEEYQIMEEKYVFLSSLYLEVLAGKEAFNNQIIGYRDSYGKLYAVVKKLDSTLPEQVFYEAVTVLEEMLSNRYVAIYSIDQKSDFARLNVCSKNCARELGKSMRLTDYPKILEKLQADEIFKNREALAGYPAYATPIFRNKKLVGMILLTKAENSQMNMEFSNKFRIVTNLIRDSLIRAMDYYDRSDANLDGTRVLGAESFRRVLAVKEQMKQKQYLEFSLLKIDSENMPLQEFSEKISSVVRNNDVIGQGEDGNMYLLLSQTGPEDLRVVEERLRKKQIAYEVVNEG